jgi:hypothetical protein
MRRIYFSAILFCLFFSGNAQVFKTNGNQYINGNLGVGINTPAQKIEIQNNGDVYTRYRYNNGTPCISSWDIGVPSVSQGYQFVFRDAANALDIIALSVGGGYVQKNQFGNVMEVSNSAKNLWLQRFAEGKVGIGMTTDPLYTLDVNGTIHAKEVLIDTNFTPADYVFDASYNLMPLHKVEAFVKTNKHLPDIPSAAEIIKNGMNMGEMQNKLLQKVEELTLYVIELQKLNEIHSREIEKLKKK